MPSPAAVKCAYTSYPFLFERASLSKYFSAQAAKSSVRIMYAFASSLLGAAPLNMSLGLHLPESVAFALEKSGSSALFQVSHVPGLAAFAAATKSGFASSSLTKSSAYSQPTPSGLLSISSPILALYLRFSDQALDRLRYATQLAYRVIRLMIYAAVIVSGLLDPDLNLLREHPAGGGTYGDFWQIVSYLDYDACVAVVEREPCGADFFAILDG